MSCYKPIKAWVHPHEKTEAGKAKIVFKPPDVAHLYRVDLPCGRCVGCRIDQARMWSLRCMHEAQMYQEKNCFLTLTFDGEHLDPEGSLRKDTFQKFMKRLRSRFSGFYAVEYKGRCSFPIRYFHVAEYGEELERPHHHCLLFNFDFPDKRFLKCSKGNRIYTSDVLDDVWSFGHCFIGDCTIESAQYVARYCVKKISGNRAAEHYVRCNKETGELFFVEPEFATMSRRPGIGYKWFKEYKNDAFSKDFITWDGKKYAVPAYYEKLYSDVDAERLCEIKEKRKARALKNWKNNTDERLAVRERVASAGLKLQERRLENV